MAATAVIPTHVAKIAVLFDDLAWDRIGRWMFCLMM